MKHLCMAHALLLAIAPGCGPDEIEHGKDTDGSEVGEEDFPERMAEAYCAALFACDPATSCLAVEAPYASAAECVAEQEQLLVEIRESAHAAGLTYDPDCVARTIAGYSRSGCDSEERLRAMDPHALDRCPPYYGTIPEGENPCFEVVGSALSECGKGLFCSEAGGDCKRDNQECRCEDGSACDPHSDFPDQCVPTLPLDSECVNDDGVVPGVCDPAETYCAKRLDADEQLIGYFCTARAELGTPCNLAEECDSLYCYETCQPGTPVLCNLWTGPGRWR